mmetsp:Transcript_125486/g.366555  ORF Transcript_125486/g.366555 Transcript_125486/m.366555 type:complete len:211 (-) Transcript_125486:1101-1733(-)
MACAAALPWLTATSQCSTRSASPVAGERYVATSPAAKRPSALVCRRSSATSEPSRAFSAPATKAALGTTPTPVMMASQRSSSPDFSTATRPPPGELSCRISLQTAFPTNFTPFVSKNFFTATPSRRPRTRSKGAASMPRTVTSQPLRRSVAAISIPMKEEPTTRARLPFLQNVAICCASSGVRRDKTPGRSAPGIGSSLGFAPVATSAAS